MDDYKKSLLQLGLNNKQETLRVVFEKTDLPFQDVADKYAALLGESNNSTQPEIAIPEPAKPPASSPIADDPAPVESFSPSEKTPSPESNTELPEPELLEKRSVQVYLPSESQRVIADDDDSQFVVSLSHAQRLQDQITRTSKPSDGPLLTKALRRKMEHAKSESIKIIQIRIRLPDQTHLEAQFKSTETIGDVISFVESSLSQPDLPFRLFTNPPKLFYTDLDATLVKTCKFSPRTLLFFEWNHDAGLPKEAFPKTGLLKADMLTSGKPITEAPDVKMDITEHIEYNESHAAPSGGQKLGGGTDGQKKKTSWLNKGKGPLSQSQKSTLMKFVQTGKK